MRSKHTLGLVLALLCVSFGCKGPEDKLADHIEEMAEIMEEYEDEPEEGVAELREYIHDNLPDMASNWAEILVDIDKAETKSDKKKRVLEVVEALKEPMQLLTKHGIPFMAAAAGDDDVEDTVKDWAEDYEELAESLQDDLKDEAEDMFDPEDLVDAVRDSAEAVCDCSSERCKRKHMVIAGLNYELLDGLEDIGAIKEKWQRRARSAREDMWRCMR